MDGVVYTAGKSKGVALRSLFGEQQPLNGITDLVFLDDSILNHADVLQTCLEIGVTPHCLFYTRVAPPEPIDDSAGLEFMQRNGLGSIDLMPRDGSSFESESDD